MTNILEKIIQEKKDTLEIIKKTKDTTPYEDIIKFCNFTNITSERFFAIAEKHRNKKIWKKDSRNKWYIKNYLI